MCKNVTFYLFSTFLLILLQFIYLVSFITTIKTFLWSMNFNQRFLYRDILKNVILANLLLSCPERLFLNAFIYTLMINWVILDCFRWSNFKIFFNHGEGIEYTLTLVINWVILDNFRWPNFKIFFNHGEGMEYTLVINWIILDYFKWSNFKIFFNNSEGMEFMINWVILDCFR